MTSEHISYASIADIAVEVDTSNTTTNASDWYTIGRWVANRIDAYLGYEFAPRIEKKYFDTPGYEYTTNYQPDYGEMTRLRLGTPLLSVTTLVDGDGDTLTAWDGVRANRSTADYTTTNKTYSDTPIWGLLRLDNSVPAHWDYDDYREQSVEITGIWGYRTRYSTDAWNTSVDTVQDNPLSSSATTLNVSDGTLFSIGQLIRIESEYLAITAISTNALTVVRAIRGSTAASHVQTTAIDIWKPEPAIVRAASRWAAYISKRQGHFQTVTIDGLGGATQFPQDMPKEVENILNELPNIHRVKIL